MSLLKKMHNVYYRYLIQHSDALKLSKNELLKYINGFSEPSNGLIRSYYQFQVYSTQWDKKLYMVLYLIFMLIYPIFKILLYSISLLNKNKFVKNSKDTESVIYIPISSNKGIFPKEKYKKKSVIIRKRSNKLFVDDEVKRIVNQIEEISNFNPIFCFYCLYNLAFYSYLINTINISEIVTTYESSFTVSALTEYCHKNGITHSNIMHGDKLFDVRNSFFWFDDFYVWDEYYISLFTQLKCKVNNFYIFNPFNDYLSKSKTVIPKIDFCFYLQDETEIELRRIKKYVDQLVKMEKVVRVRPHPAGFSREYIDKLFDDYLIEDISEINIYDSLNRTQFAISQYSTVLFQAHSLGKEVVIDNLSNPELFEIMKDRGHIIFHKNHTVLSEILNKVN